MTTKYGWIYFQKKEKKEKLKKLILYWLTGGVIYK